MSSSAFVAVFPSRTTCRDWIHEHIFTLHCCLFLPLKKHLELQSGRPLITCLSGLLAATHLPFTQLKWKKKFSFLRPSAINSILTETESAPGLNTSLGGGAVRCQVYLCEVTIDQSQCCTGISFELLPLGSTHLFLFHIVHVSLAGALHELKN